MVEFCVKCGVRVVAAGGECPLCGFDAVVATDRAALDLLAGRSPDEIAAFVSAIADPPACSPTPEARMGRDDPAGSAPPMSDARLRWISGLCDAATPGPWVWWTSNSFRRLSARKDGDVLSGAIQRDGQLDVACSEEDRAFVAASRTVVPELLAEVARLRLLTSELDAEVEAHRQWLQDGHARILELTWENAQLRGAASRDRVRALVREISEVALSDAIPGRVDLAITQIATRAADAIAAASVLSPPPGTDEQLDSLLPERKEWDAERHDRGDVREEDGYESSDYVEGWNDALDSARDALESAARSGALCLLRADEATDADEAAR